MSSPEFGDARLPERFWAKAQPDANGCWRWTAASLGNGYSGFWWGRWTFAHRVAYAQLVDAVPADLDLDHLCRVKRCVNPAHLEPVSHQENVRRGWAARKAEVLS